MCVRVLFLIIIESSPVRKVLTISHCSKVNLITFDHETRVQEHVSLWLLASQLKIQAYLRGEFTHSDKFAS